MQCRKRTQVMLALCLLLVLWQSFQASISGLGHLLFTPSLFAARRPPQPTARCSPSTNTSAWFNAHYNAAVGTLLTGAAHELSPDVVQWWLTLQGPPRSTQLQAIIQELFTVLPAPKGSVWDPSQCRRCAVVGNSGRLKGSRHGPRIDAHDWVLRMNRAKTAGFEMDVGTRTTHHFMYPESAMNLWPGVHLVLVPFKPLDLKWVTSAFSTGELSHTYMRVKQFIKADRNKVLILNPAFLKYIHETWLQGHGRYPSTGFTALLFALHACQQALVLRAQRGLLPLCSDGSARGGGRHSLQALGLTECPRNDGSAGLPAGLCVWLWSRQQRELASLLGRKPLVWSLSQDEGPRR